MRDALRHSRRVDGNRSRGKRRVSFFFSSFRGLRISEGFQTVVSDMMIFYEAMYKHQINASDFSGRGDDERSFISSTHFIPHAMLERRAIVSHERQRRQRERERKEYERNAVVSHEQTQIYKCWSCSSCSFPPQVPRLSDMRRNEDDDNRKKLREIRELR
jgi:hypothetical protein